jgi:hypothetical protein
VSLDEGSEEEEQLLHDPSGVERGFVADSLSLKEPVARFVDCLLLRRLVILSLRTCQDLRDGRRFNRKVQ